MYFLKKSSKIYKILFRELNLIMTILHKNMQQKSDNLIILNQTHFSYVYNRLFKAEKVADFPKVMEIRV